MGDERGEIARKQAKIAHSVMELKSLCPAVVHSRHSHSTVQERFVILEKITHFYILQTSCSQG